MLILVVLLSACQNGDTGEKEYWPPMNHNSVSSEGGADSSADGGSTDTKRNDVSSLPPAADLECSGHKDENADDACDECGGSVIVVVDFYNINDLHGKFDDTDSQPGVDELTTYLKNAKKTDDHTVLLSSGDMWQGSAESNMTKGKIVTDWMSHLDFAGMALGNHEFDWGEQYVADNAEIAEFPFLAINIYDRTTNERVEYASASTTVECGGVTIGIIGAIGDCYSSISPDRVENIYFKTGSELTALVKEEAEDLREAGADFIVYALHAGLSSSKSGVTNISGNEMYSYYDIELSEGYVDLVFEGHTHKQYVAYDRHGTYHFQNGGENKGISHAEVAINYVNDTFYMDNAEFVSTARYAGLEDDPIVDELLEKYKEDIAEATKVVGINSSYKSSGVLCDIAAQTYFDAGVKRWGDRYNIALGGGFFQARSPYDLPAGEVTYGDLQAIFPFDNQLVLCSIQGKYLSSKFFNTSNSSYHIAYGDYGSSIKGNIDPNATYYVVVDTYTSSYAPNRLTVVEYYDEGVYARDLLAEWFAKK